MHNARRRWSGDQAGQEAIIRKGNKWREKKNKKIKNKTVSSTHPWLNRVDRNCAIRGFHLRTLAIFPKERIISGRITLLGKIRPEPVDNKGQAIGKIKVG